MVLVVYLVGFVHLVEGEQIFAVQDIDDVGDCAFVALENFDELDLFHRSEGSVQDKDDRCLVL